MDTQTAASLDAARGGDPKAFETLVAPWQAPLRAYCYRMLGSLSDADDAVQEALVRAWKGLRGFEGRAQLRTWLYQIATRVCLDAIDRRGSRTLPHEVHPAAKPGDAINVDAAYQYIDPAPDSWTDEPATGPDVVIERKESVALAFLVALQALPATQRAVLILRDVLGLQATEVAELLETTVAAVNSSLQRARATIETRTGKTAARPALSEDGTRSLLQKYLRVWETSDVAALLALLREDALVSMPPMALWFNGAKAAAEFFGAVVMAPSVDAGRFRGIPTNAAGRPALAIYAREKPGAPFLPAGLHVLESDDGARIVALVAWITPALFARFGLPASIGP